MWLFSPLYLSARAGKRGFFHFSDIADSSFARSHFYSRYYRPSEIGDHVAYICETGNGDPLVLSIERSTSRSNYTELQMIDLRLIESVICSLVRKNWPGSMANSEVFGSIESVDLDEALQTLGVSVLTPRERETLMLLLTGHPNKLVARELGISLETVKVYCRAIYSKFCVSSRAELFAKVLELMLK